MPRMTYEQFESGNYEEKMMDWDGTVPHKKKDRANILKSWYEDYDEYFEQRDEIAKHYDLLKMVANDWVWLHLNETRDFYGTMKKIKTMKCEGCWDCCQKDKWTAVKIA
tara:strand:- start:230 stop:556 length:327 start_codon:yes stop_codon:yes gene_type:complete